MSDTNDISRPLKGFLGRFIFLLGMIIYTSGCATTVTTHPPREVTNLKELCEQNNVSWQWDSVSEVVTLNRGGIKAKTLIGSNTVVIDEEPIVLSVPLKRRKGVVIVPSDFKRKVIDRLAPKKNFSYLKFKRIIVDAGHGGKDPGAMGRSGVKEKNVVLDIAKRLKRRLEDRGFEVIMTRNSDKFISLEERARIAARAKGDLFLSVHANANRSRSINGTEVYYARDSAQALKSNEIFEKNCKLYFSQLSMAKNSPPVEQILTAILSQNKQFESQKLAQHLSKNTLDDGETKSRGSRMAGFYVLKNTSMPAVLVEVGYLTNKSEETLLKTSSYRQKIAEMLAKGIADYSEQ